jgi:hypothetical protein
VGKQVVAGLQERGARMVMFHNVMIRRTAPMNHNILIRRTAPMNHTVPMFRTAPMIHNILIRGTAPMNHNVPIGTVLIVTAYSCM